MERTQRISLAIFVALLSFPLLGNMVGLRFVEPVAENRFLQSPPVFPRHAREISPAIQNTDLFLRDRFGFRDELLRLSASLRHVGLFGAEKNSVLRGKEGQLFQWEHSDRMAWSAPTTDLPAWRASLERIAKWLGPKRYFVWMSVPATMRIYPEYLPPEVPAKSASTFQQILAGLAGRLPRNIVLVDLEKTLLGAKGAEPLFLRTDTHWNEIGAQVAYQEILEAIRQATALPLKTLQADKVDWRLSPGGNLAHQLGTSATDREYRPHLKFNEVEKTKITEIASTKRGDVSWSLLYQNPEGIDRTVLVLCDSFFDSIRGRLAENFRRVYFFHHEALHPQLLEELQPDIIIYESTDRNLLDPQSAFDGFRRQSPNEEEGRPGTL